MEWMSAPNNADHGVGRELVNAQDRICEKWKVKFHDFKSLEKVNQKFKTSFGLSYLALPRIAHDDTRKKRQDDSAYRKDACLV